eukprot:1509537-Rhodomonas_salina.3
MLIPGTAAMTMLKTDLAQSGYKEGEVASREHFRYAICGTDTAYAATWSAICGTNTAYAATRRGPRSLLRYCPA